MLTKKQLYKMLKEAEEEGRRRIWNKFLEDFVLLDIKDNKDIDMIYEHYIASMEEKNEKFGIGMFDHYWTFLYENNTLIKIRVEDAFGDGGVEWELFHYQ